MRVIARGWKRRDPDNAIVPNADFEVAYQYPNGGFGDGEPCLRRRSNGDIELSIGPVPIKLSANYQVIVTLTKEEILTLVAESLKDDSYPNAIKSLALAILRVTKKKEVPFRERVPVGGKEEPIHIEDI